MRKVQMSYGKLDKITQTYRLMKQVKETFIKSMYFVVLQKKNIFFFSSKKNKSNANGKYKLESGIAHTAMLFLHTRLSIYRNRYGHKTILFAFE